MRADFQEGMRTATFQFSESGGSVNGPNLFTELPFLEKSLPNPWFTELPPPFSLKNPFFHWKVLRVCNSGAGKACANFMGAWKNAFFLQENLHVHKIPRFRGGVFWVWGGGCRFYFYGCGIFLIYYHSFWNHYIFNLSGMFRRSASLAIPHHKSFTAIPPVSLNRSVKLAHKSQPEVALV